MGSAAARLLTLWPIIADVWDELVALIMLKKLKNDCFQNNACHSLLDSYNSCGLNNINHLPRGGTTRIFAKLQCVHIYYWAAHGVVAHLDESDYRSHMNKSQLLLKRLSLGSPLRMALIYKIFHDGTLFLLFIPPNRIRMMACPGNPISSRFR
jgi:hypothetical protein